MNERNPGHVLVVDDEPEIRECLVEAMEDAGYSAEGAAHGRDALDRLRRPGGRRPDLILLDLLMPVLDGPAFRAEQQQDPSIAAIPTVVISANAKVKETAAAMGVTAWLRKPLDLNELLRLVGSLVEPRGAGASG